MAVVVVAQVPKAEMAHQPLEAQVLQMILLAHQELMPKEAVQETINPVLMVQQIRVMAVKVLDRLTMVVQVVQVL